ncbi:TonB-dependent receptor [Methylobacillus gramineus]|uniref:TonB-dependent receptor domain-containing protein n=1 Tax=Methylobacillus gramineus TaxID=755169 RepID=UPI001CFF812A|nr:TonB-dependent receptor [Methylobacillus gramineus]MCB5183614.1 TonB-dependent receptor [Methylobacillus gramineus]
MNHKETVSYSTVIPTRPPLPSHLKLSKFASAIGAIFFLSSGAFAADESSLSQLQAENARIQAENAKLKEELEKSRQELAAQKGEPLSTQINTNPAISSPEQVAQEEPSELGKIVVKAQSQLELVHDEPKSISVISGAELDRELALDLGAITRRTAGIQFNQNNTRGASLSIRGLGKRSFTETQDPSVGLVVDGVPYGLTQLGNFDFFDIDNVEVQRGPSGTQGGLASSAGVVNIKTKRPSFTPSADYQLVYGQRDAVIAKANLGGAVVDDVLAWRGSFIADRGRGFYDSEYDSNYSFYNRNRLAGRIQFLLTPTENLSARFSFDLEPKAAQVENGLTFRKDQPLRYVNGSLTDASGITARAKLVGFLNNAGTFTSGRAWFANRSFSSNGTVNPNYTYDDYINNKLLQNENQGQSVTNKGASAEVNYLIPNHTLTSITAWRSYSFDAHNDEGTPFDINRNGGGGVDYRQYSQEFRIVSDPGEKIDYSGGVFLMKTEDTISSKTGWGSDAGAWLGTNAQYNALERNAGINRGSGLALLKDSLDDAYTVADTKVDTTQGAVYGQVNWHLTEKLDLLTGLRITREDRSTEDTKILSANGVGAALNPESIRGVPLGGFNSVAFGSTGAGDAPTSENSSAQLQLADSVAAKFFGATITSTPGQAYNGLSVEQKNMIAAAKAIRANAIGALSNGVKSSYRDVLFTAVVSPSYKVNDNFTAYTSWQYGEKSGSALNINFVSSTVKPEKTNAYEIGFKSNWLENTLTLNADIFYMDIRDYQSAIRVVDEFTTATNIANLQPNPIAYVTAQGNVKRAKSQGVEIDAFYSGIPYTTVRFAGAYNDAKYVDFKNAAFPEELAYLSTATAPYTDQSGMTLPGVSKWTFNVGAEYRRPVLGDKLFHTSFNTSYNSKYNNTDNLSSYGHISPFSRTDLSIGLQINKTFDLSLIARNVFDNRSHEEGWTQYSPYPYPRWVGISFSGKM